MTLSEKGFSIETEEIQLTHAPFGHCINSTQCFSPDGRYIVYDTRNDDGALAANGQIRVLDIQTGEDLLIYQTENQTEFGPGVGAATWSPDGGRLLFLGGIQNADGQNPYSFTRRTGIGVFWHKPGVPVWMDARDINPPFTPGALRGGTHAHTWSGQDNWISFTYNDHVVAEAARTDSSLADLRTVGIMFPHIVKMPHSDGVENKNGCMYSVLIAPVVKDPVPGSGQVSRAFDECWIGANGYITPDGSRQRKAIAYQGHVSDSNGQRKTEIFVADIPDDLPECVRLYPAAGTMREMPAVPPCIRRRRISSLPHGVSAVPRHWLRSVPDGSLIGFLATDKNNIIQLWGISPNGGEARQLSRLPASVSGPFNFSPDGRFAACTADGRVWVIRLSDGTTTPVTSMENSPGQLNGAVVWSPNGKELCYNRYVQQEEGTFLQVFLVRIKNLR